jgi:hypothetical protein
VPPRAARTAWRPFRVRLWKTSESKRIFKKHLGDVIHEYAEQDAATAAEISELEGFIGRLAEQKPA